MYEWCLEYGECFAPKATIKGSLGQFYQILKWGALGVIGLSKISLGWEGHYFVRVTLTLSHLFTAEFKLGRQKPAGIKGLLIVCERVYGFMSPVAKHLEFLCKAFVLGMLFFISACVLRIH